MLIHRPATQADLPAAWALRTRAVRTNCATHYPPAVIEVWSTSAAPASLIMLIDAGSVMVAEEDGQVAGFAALNLDSGELDAAFVDPAHQGRGIALQLLRQLEAMALQRGLGRLFLSASLNAAPFYARAGYVALREEVYPHRSGVGIASVFMEKLLPPS